MTSISKLDNSIYLSGTFQLNEGCFRASQPSLCLCTSLWLPVPVPDWDPASASLSTIITALTISAWFEIFCTACICLFLLSDYVCLVWHFFSWHHVMLLASNVITLIYFSHYCLLYAYFQVCIRYKYLQCTLLYLYMCTGDTLQAWLVHPKRLDPISHLTGYVCTYLIYTVYIHLSWSVLAIVTCCFSQSIYHSLGSLLGLKDWLLGLKHDFKHIASVACLPAESFGHSWDAQFGKDIKVSRYKCTNWLCFNTNSVCNTWGSSRAV